MPAAKEDPERQYEWRTIKIRREAEVDSAEWLRTVFLSCDMHDAWLAVWVPADAKATTRLDKKAGHRIG